MNACDRPIVLKFNYIKDEIFVIEHFLCRPLYEKYFNFQKKVSSIFFIYQNLLPTSADPGGPGHLLTEGF